MVIGIGCDIVEISRIKNSIKKFGDKFLNKIFTPKEIDYCKSRARSEQHFAGRFAAKEAIAKALYQLGIESIDWQNIEVINSPKGVPQVKILNISLDKDIDIKLSISHSNENAIAYAIIQKL
ncbi:MAG TPA: holo-ACP synthase [Ignavibacteriales bacterium]|nr:holo-ACP synthase [Ignavibacteriales bacterium]HOL80518.1 holo-ACP synthase [Ignavibacteriales bacterium]HOM64207.1 holo-ACP synthase [Ignavibacteriales bacterium]HPD67320.1 holo-ACP synthase [Ignavibacteriales bacterium]HPP33146.1 holo-ACP synthase [Ignavibacteriales bacterium]